MNQKQRDFLVDTITKKANEQISDLERKNRNLNKGSDKLTIIKDTRQQLSNQ
jgi:hypothetical protein